MKIKQIFLKKASLLLVLITIIGAIGVGAVLPQGEQTIVTEPALKHKSDAIIFDSVFITGFAGEETTYRVASGYTQLQTGGATSGNGSHWSASYELLKLKKVGTNVGNVIITFQGFEYIIDGDELSTEGSWVEIPVKAGCGGCGEHPYPWTLKVKAPQAGQGSGVGWAYNEVEQKYLHQIWGMWTPLWC